MEKPKFAYIFNKLQLAQAEGQGISTILKTMKEEGCPKPIFKIKPDSIVCILKAHTIYTKVQIITPKELKQDLLFRNE